MEQSETETVTAGVLTSLKKGDLQTAKRDLESLMIVSGLSGREVLSEIRTMIRREYNHPEIAIALAEADARFEHCNNEFIQLGSLLTDIRSVFI